MLSSRPANRICVPTKGLAYPRPYWRLVEGLFRDWRRVTTALRRQRSHVRIVSGAPDFSLFYNAICARGLKLQLRLFRVSKRLRWKIVAECRELCSEATQHNNPGAQVSHSIPKCTFAHSRS